jgi:hypothetical protein
VGSGQVTLIGCPTVFFGSLSSYEGQAPLLYVGAGETEFIGSPHASFQAVFHFQGLGGLNSLPGGQSLSRESYQDWGPDACGSTTVFPLYFAL